MTLLYPRCSMTALQLFATQTLDSGTYLRSDYSIRSACTHRCASLLHMWLQMRLTAASSR